MRFYVTIADKTNSSKIILLCCYKSQSENRWQCTVPRRLPGEKRKCVPGVHPPGCWWAAKRGGSCRVGRRICYTESGAKSSPRFSDTAFCELFTPAGLPVALCFSAVFFLCSRRSQGYYRSGNGEEKIQFFKIRGNSGNFILSHGKLIFWRKVREK